MRNRSFLILGASRVDTKPASAESQIAWFSLKKHNPDYSGNCLRLKKSDGQIKSFGFSGNYLNYQAIQTWTTETDIEIIELFGQNASGLSAVIYNSSTPGLRLKLNGTNSKIEADGNGGLVIKSVTCANLKVTTSINRPNDGKTGGLVGVFVGPSIYRLQYWRYGSSLLMACNRQGNYYGAYPYGDSMYTFSINSNGYSYLEDNHGNKLEDNGNKVTGSTEDIGLGMAQKASYKVTGEIKDLAIYYSEDQRSLVENLFN